MTQPQKKIPELNAPSLPIGGTVLFEGDQGGDSVYVSAQNIWDAAPVPSGLLPITQQSGTSYVFALVDAETMVEFTNASSIGATVPNNNTVAFPIGTTINGAQDNTGVVTISAAGGVTIKSYTNLVSTAGQNAVFTLLKTAANTWRLFGILA